MQILTKASVFHNTLRFFRGPPGAVDPTVSRIGTGTGSISDFRSISTSLGTVTPGRPVSPTTVDYKRKKTS